MKLHVLAVAVVCLLAGAGCSTADSSSGTSPAALLATAPSTPLVTETFSGTVQPGSNDSHPFTVTSDGFQITLAMTAAGPPATIAEGLGIGQVVSGSCQLLSGGFGTFTPSITPQLAGTIPAGSYCAMVYDVGNQSAAITYTVIVQHY
ncbi:MAG: hypothetical protein JWL71_3253 [Acidobacteria bacterium]|nr:hypothetical protein [Acidobacteriota bacterium]